MKREDIEKLLGGYATGTLTEEERRALFDAALTDQALFDSLAGEEALREVLEDPRCRRQIEQALRDEHAGFLERVAGWIRRPTAWALAGSLAATAAITVLVVRTAQEPRPEVHLAQQKKVEGPAPAPAPGPAASTPSAPARPESRMASKAAPEQKPAAPEKKEQAAPSGVAGGVVGGVVGGVIPSAQSPAPPPAEPPVLAESRAPVAAPAPSPAAPADTQQLPPPPAAARESKDVASVNAMGPVQFAEKPGTRALSTSLRQDAPAASAVQTVRYDVLVKEPNGQFVAADPRTPVAPGVPVRLVLMPNQTGSLSVYGDTRNLLFSTSNAFAGSRYTVDAPPSDRKFTVVLAPVSDAAKTSAPSALRQSVQKGKLPGGRLITVIDLTRPRN